MNDHTDSPYEYWMSLHNAGGRASPGRCWLPEQEEQARAFVNEQPFRRILVKVVVCPEDLAKLRKGWWNT